MNDYVQVDRVKLRDLIDRVPVTGDDALSWAVVRVAAALNPNVVTPVERLAAWLRDGDRDRSATFTPGPGTDVFLTVHDTGAPDPKARWGRGLGSDVDDAITRALDYVDAPTTRAEKRT